MYIVIVILIAIIVAITSYMNHPKFGRLPQGERLERIKKSPNYRDGAFQNLHTTPQLTSDKSRIRTMIDFLFEKRERNRPEEALPAIKSDLKSLKAGENLLVWFGHSSYLLQDGDKRILIDPVFEDASPVSFFNKSFKGTDIFKAEDMPDIDYLVITHDHWDHLDYATVTKLKNRVGKVICPLGVGEHFERWGFNKNSLIEMDWNEQASLVDGYTIYCLPTRHFSGRTFKSNQTLWASFMIKTPSQTIYIGGDGGYDTHYAEINKRFPHIDLALLENGQYNKDWRYIHLLPEDLKKAIKDLKPLKVFAGHNSKYTLAKHPWDEPLKNAYTLVEKDSVNLLMPIIGEIVHLNDTIQPIKKWWNGRI